MTTEIADITDRNGAITGERKLTWPNLLTGFRLIGSPVLVLLALYGQPLWVGVLTGILVLTEWLDGLLARALHEVSALGARMDTVADAVFYSSLLAALACLNPTLIGREVPWIAAAIGSYGCSWLASWIKFRRLPSYHTWAAKSAWLAVGIGTVCLLAGPSAWPFRVAMICVVLANVEATLITFVMDECQVNVRSLWSAMGSGKTTDP